MSRPDSLDLPVGRVAGTADLHLPIELDGYVLVPPGRAGRAGDRRPVGYVVLVRPGGVAAFTAELAAIAPAAWIQNTGDAEAPAPGTSPTAWVRAGLTLGVGLAVLMVVVAALGDAEAERARLRRVLLLGAPRRTVIAAHLTTQLAPLVLLSTAAILVGSTCAVIMGSIDHRAVTPAAPVAAIAAVALGVSVAIPALTLPLVVGRATVGDLRDGQPVVRAG